MNRDEAIKRIKAGLKDKTGKTWSVTAGRGTAWGWLTIQSTPKRRVFHDTNPELAEHDFPYPRGLSRTIDRQPMPGEKGHYTSEPERRELAKVLGLVNQEIAHHQGVLISPDEYRRFVAILES